MIPDAAVEAVVVARYGYSVATWQGRWDAIRRDLEAALPHLLTDEMVERAATAMSDEIAYIMEDERWKQVARAALEAALRR